MNHGKVASPFTFVRDSVIKRYFFSFSGPNASRSDTESLSGSFTLNQTALFALTGTREQQGWCTRHGVRGIVTQFDAKVQGSAGSNEPLSLGNVVGFSIVGRGLSENESLVDAPGFGNLILCYAGANFSGAIVANGGSYGTDLALLGGRIESATTEPVALAQKRIRQRLRQVLGLAVRS